MLWFVLFVVNLMITVFACLCLVISLLVDLWTYLLVLALFGVIVVCAFSMLILWYCRGFACFVGLCCFVFVGFVCFGGLVWLFCVNLL